MVKKPLSPTRNGKLRRLDLDTAKLLELAGYEIVDYHRAILFKDISQQTLSNFNAEEEKECEHKLEFWHYDKERKVAFYKCDYCGDVAVKHHKGRLSFFKRNSLNKGNVAAMFEDILIGVKV